MRLSPTYYLHQVPKLCAAFRFLKLLLETGASFAAFHIWDFIIKLEHGRAESVYDLVRAIKTSFEDEVQKIGEFVGVTLSPEDVERIREKTSLLRLRERAGEATKPEAQRFLQRRHR